MTTVSSKGANNGTQAFSLAAGTLIPGRPQSSQR